MPYKKAPNPLKLRKALLKYGPVIVLLNCMSAVCIAQRDSVQMGIASYYHPKFEGRKTSNGEIFRNDSLTAAHKKLPFGTYVRVTNLYNDSVVIVRINDRLPQNSKRSIDLTQAAAKKLNMMRSGIVKAKIEILPPARKDTLLTADTLILASLPVKTDTLIKNDSIARDSVIITEEPELIGKGYRFKKYTVTKNKETMVFVKAVDPNGTITYKKNGEFISEEEFKKETGTK